jgi:ribonuclease HII
LRKGLTKTPAGEAILALVRRTGNRLLRFDRKLGARFVAGTDEAGRGPLAGPLVVAGVLLDLDCLREHKARPFTYLNDSKQLTPGQREELFYAVLSCAERVVTRIIPAEEIDRRGLHRSNLDGLRAMLEALTPPAEACLVDGFRLGKAAPEHSAIVDGDTKSAAIAAASVIAKVTRDRLMRRMDALYPHYGFSSHVGYITPSHTRIVIERGPSPIHRRSWRARCYAEIKRAELQRAELERAQSARVPDRRRPRPAEPAAADGSPR